MGIAWLLTPARLPLSCRMIQTNFIDMENMFDLLKEEPEVSEGKGRVWGTVGDVSGVWNIPGQ